MAKDEKKEKVYITRDESPLDNLICVWKKPIKGNWSPQKLPDCEIVNWQRDDIENMDIYSAEDFKKKFGLTIHAKTKKCVHLPYKLVHNEDYKQFSNDPKRKK